MARAAGLASRRRSSCSREVRWGGISLKSLPQIQAEVEYVCALFRKQPNESLYRALALRAEELQRFFLAHDADPRAPLLGRARQTILHALQHGAEERGKATQSTRVDKPQVGASSGPAATDASNDAKPPKNSKPNWTTSVSGGALALYSAATDDKLPSRRTITASSREGKQQLNQLQVAHSSEIETKEEFDDDEADEEEMHVMEQQGEKERKRGSELRVEPCTATRDSGGCKDEQSAPGSPGSAGPFSPTTAEAFLAQRDAKRRGPAATTGLAALVSYVRENEPPSPPVDEEPTSPGSAQQASPPLAVFTVRLSERDYYEVLRRRSLLQAAERGRAASLASDRAAKERGPDMTPIARGEPFKDPRPDGIWW